MANHNIETQWMGKMQFNALVNDHTIIMDAPERAGGEEYPPGGGGGASHQADQGSRRLERAGTKLTHKKGSFSLPFVFIA